MRFYFAPMEGVTGYLYRNAHQAYFTNPDKYFSPFISANSSQSLKSKEMNDILPENNQAVHLIPQLLTNRSVDFIETSKLIRNLGYQEINLNLGCPSGTVVSKFKGAGFLAKPEALRVFLEEIFAAAVTKISVKTRLGMTNPEEFHELLELFNQFPIEEIIIHPRVQKDFYKNKPNLQVFREALSHSKNPVCYNGNIFAKEDYLIFLEAFPEVESIMLGRGLLANPGLVGVLLGQSLPAKTEIKAFHDRIYQSYRETLFGDKNVLFKMKEIWYYMSVSFTEQERYLKKIRKAEHLREYEDAVERLFREQEFTAQQISF